MKNKALILTLSVFLGCCCMNVTEAHAETHSMPLPDVEKHTQNEQFLDVFQKHLQTLKYLDVSHPRLLVMFSGTPGMGKTTVAKSLEDELQAIRLSTDEARFFLRQSGLSTSLADRYIDWCLERVTEISANHLIILDRSVDRTYPGYLEFAKYNGYATLLVRMQVPRTTVEERIRARLRDDTNAILAKADRSWADYECFNKQYAADYVFVNSHEVEAPLKELVAILAQKIKGRYSFQNLVPGTQEFLDARSMILNSASLDDCSDPDPMHEILPGLYLGNQQAAYNIASYKNISHVLSLRTEPPEIGLPHITWKGIPITDSQESRISAHFDETFDFIESTDGAILVHCREGVSRSASITIAYLMRKFDVPYQAAFDFVQKKRPVIQPNKGFQNELKQYEVQLQERVSK